MALAQPCSLKPAPWISVRSTTWSSAQPMFKRVGWEKHHLQHLQSVGVSRNGVSNAQERRRRISNRLTVAASADQGASPPIPAFTKFKRILLPIVDKNPYLSDATKQACYTTADFAKKYDADITVVVIDEASEEASPEHDMKISNIRWHMAEGGFTEFGLLERLGEGKKPAAIVGEVADEMGLDLVVMSMETIHQKHVDGNLLAEFVPCPVLLLPL